MCVYAHLILLRCKFSAESCIRIKKVCFSQPGSQILKFMSVCKQADCVIMCFLKDFIMCVHSLCGL